MTMTLGGPGRADHLRPRPPVVWLSDSLPTTMTARSWERGVFLKGKCIDDIPGATMSGQVGQIHGLFQLGLPFNGTTPSVASPVFL